MSKYVKNLVTDHLRQQLDGVDNAVLVNVVGLDANATAHLRTELDGKDIHLMVVKNSLAARATQGTPLEAAFVGLTGPAAICWGGEDIVSLSKEITRLAKEEEYEGLEARGGAMEGENLTAEQVTEISKWPNRDEQLSLLVGQVLSPGANLVSQLIGPGANLASQIAQKAEGDETEGDEAGSDEAGSDDND